jgi:polysaccharide export outer membrane protein
MRQIPTAVRAPLTAGLFLVAALPALAADTTAVTPASLPSAASSSSTGAVVSADYKIGPGDQLDVNVFDIGDLSRSVQVDAGGKIILPLIGEMNATNQTSDELAQNIADALKRKYVKNPLVTVTVKEAASQRVTVDGAVGAPGVYPLTGATTLMQAVALAKGADPKTANLHRVELIRLVAGERQSKFYDLASIRAGHTPDPKIEGRDIVVVETSGAKTLWNNFVQIAPTLAFLHP